MGELRQRGRIWWIRYYRNGRRYEESSGSATKTAAERLLKLREGDVARGLPVTPHIGRLRFDEAAQDVVNDYTVNRKRSLAHVARRIRLHLGPFFGFKRMTAITTADIRTFTAKRQAEGASNAEINRELAILKRAFRLARQAGKLLLVPYIPMLAENNARSGFFERQEFEDVRGHLPHELRGVVTFAYLTGWRTQSEILPLEWRRVDRKAMIVRLDPGSTKNRQARVFPYGSHPELREVIAAAWAEHEELRSRGSVCPFVFHRDGARITAFRSAWVKATRDAGLPGKLIHDFRRSAVRNLVRAGVAEQTAMKLTGHLTRSIFDRYDIVNESDLNTAVSRVADFGTGTKKGQSGQKEGSGRVSTIRRSLQVIDG